MPRIYTYVGPQEIRAKVGDAPAGTRIASGAELVVWCAAHADDVTPHGLIPFTYVISIDGELLVAPRRSEHVACAGGAGVCSAGEMFIQVAGTRAEVVEVTNQSTGYCPEPTSWPVVEGALERAGITHPGAFTTDIIFRLCPKCDMRNIVKDDWFFCGNCQGELPAEYNLP